AEQHLKCLLAGFGDLERDHALLVYLLICLHDGEVSRVAVDGHAWSRGHVCEKSLCVRSGSGNDLKMESRGMLVQLVDYSPEEAETHGSARNRNSQRNLHLTIRGHLLLTLGNFLVTQGLG